MREKIVSKLDIPTNCIYISDKLQIMKKPHKIYTRTTASGSDVQEVYVPYDSSPLLYSPGYSAVELKEFRYSAFKAVLDKSPFTIGEWARLLYVSERTMHRYAREDAAFNGLQAERILILEELVDTGNDLMDQKGFSEWVRATPFSLQGRSVFDNLFTHQGIRECIDLIHRMEHGLPA